ncbi:MAG: sigma-70 family RNA polymerase sigma factor [Oscillospiraceae bacterium]|nr:sigma-70 family RNA polymerase sigma factor [Oscillospiraceae bacterium]
MSRLEELIARSQDGDKEAAEALVVENAGLIWSVAKRFAGRGTDSDDLYQIGCLGFLKAVQGFDLGFGTQFSTYAVPKIAGEIRRFLRDDGTVKVSRGIKERAFTIKNERNRMILEFGREPTVTELADATGFTPEQIAVADSATATVESIQQEAGEEGFTLESVLTDTESEDNMLDKIALKQALDLLSERESMVIRLRYFHGLTQERVSRILQVSQVQVSRIEKKALIRLRQVLS